MTGASSAVSCRSTTSAPSSSSSICAVGVGDDVVEASQAQDQAGDVIGRGDRDAHLVAGHDRDVIDGQDVGGVGHRHQQRALVGERDGHGL